MKYQKGFQYQLTEDEVFKVPAALTPKETIVTPFIHLTAEGTLNVRMGYAWDGASGPIKAIDRFLQKVSKWAWKRYVKKFIRGALCHDALCQMLRHGLIPAEWLHAVNEFMFDILIEDGMARWRARAWVDTLDSMDFYADPANKREVFTAP